VAEQAVEDVRNVEDGTERELGCPRTWTPPVDVAKREASPQEGDLTVLQRWGGHEPKELCRGAKAQERMNPSSKEAGGRRAKEHRRAHRKRESSTVAGNPISRWSRAYNTLESRQPHERRPTRWRHSGGTGPGLNPSKGKR
jgi:hypothetical protein